MCCLSTTGENELTNPQIAGRPDLMFGRTSLTLYSGMNGLLENDFINVKNTSFEIIAEIETWRRIDQWRHRRPGRPLRWLEPVLEGRHTEVYTYNYVGIESYTRYIGSAKLPKGKSTVKMDFVYDGGKPGAGGTATLYINDQGSGLHEDQAKTEFAAFSRAMKQPVWASTRRQPVSEDYTPLATSKFTGKVGKVTINLKK